MENQKPEDVNKVLNQMQAIKFKGVFMAALDLLKREPILLIALFLAPVLVTGLLESYAYPPIYGAVSSAGAVVFIILTILFAIISALISFFGSGLLFNAASHVYDHKKVDVGKSVAFVQTHFVDAIKLAIKLFVYTGAWIILAYFLAMTILLPFVPSLAGILAMLSPIAVIVYIIVFFKKIINASMSYAIFWSAEKPGVEASLKRSLELCEGLTWTVFGNYLLMGLVGAVAGIVLTAVLAAILVILGDAATAITAAVTAGIIGTFYACFQYCLKGQMEKFRGGHHGHTSEHSTAHHA